MDSAVEPQTEVRRQRFPWFRRRAVITPLLVLLVVWLWVVVEAAQVDGGPAGVGLASDFAMFYSASHLLIAHGNSYDPGQLHRDYSAVLRFLATPYAHINDVILLTPPVLAILGANARRATWPLAASILYLLFIAVIAVPIHIPITVEPLELLAAVVCLPIAAHHRGYRNEALLANQPRTGQAVGIP